MEQDSSIIEPDQVVTAAFFGMVPVPHNGRWTAGEFWIEQSDEDLCAGGVDFESCTARPASELRLQVSIGYPQELDGDVPDTRSVVAIGPSEITGLIMSTADRVLCEASAEVFAGLDSISVTSCEISTSDKEVSVSMYFTTRSGELLEYGIPIVLSPIVGNETRNENG